jgi:hypothetical protein
LGRPDETGTLRGGVDVGNVDVENVDVENEGVGGRVVGMGRKLMGSRTRESGSSMV